MTDVLPQLVADRAKDDPDRVFLQQVNGAELTHREIHTANLRWADAFERAGVRGGDNVITMLPAVPEAYNAWLGLAWLRAREVPINIMYVGHMLGYVIANSQAKVVVISSAFVERLADVRDALGNVEKVVVPDASSVDVDLPCEVLTRDAFLGGTEPKERTEVPGRWDIACIIYTSGTTGPSKGVLVPWGQMYHGSLSSPDDALPPSGAYYSFFPPFHMSGKYAFYLPMVKGARLVMRDWFSVTDYWDDIRKYGCTTGLLVGPMAQMLLAQPERPDDADNPLYGIALGPLFGGWERFCERFDVKVYTGFGMTEIGGPLRTEPWTITDPASCGKVRPGFECRVVDEHDIEVAPGVVGELIVRSDEPWALNAGYFGMPEKTAEAWRNGWFHTGDGFRYDSDGNFSFVDRIKDAIRRRGENISSFEVEMYVSEHDEVAECAAIGVPSELGEEDVKVCVVRTADSALEPQELVAWLEPRMPRFMLPRYVEFVGSLPKTEATQRVKKAELRVDALNDRTWDRGA